MPIFRDIPAYSVIFRHIPGFHNVPKLLFTPEIDLIASRVNKQFPIYASYRPDPNALASYCMMPLHYNGQIKPKRLCFSSI